VALKSLFRLFLFGFLSTSLLVMASCAPQKQVTAESESTASGADRSRQIKDTRYLVAGNRNKTKVLWAIESMNLPEGACWMLYSGSAGAPSAASAPERDDQVTAFGMEDDGRVNVIYVGNRTLTRISPQRAKEREPYWCQLSFEKYQQLVKASEKKEKDLGLANHSCLMTKSACYIETLNSDYFSLPDDLKPIAGLPRVIRRIGDNCLPPYLLDDYGACRLLTGRPEPFLIKPRRGCLAGTLPNGETPYCSFFKFE
jgi:hypothetical protein